MSVTSIIGMMKHIIIRGLGYRYLRLYRFSFSLAMGERKSIMRIMKIIGGNQIFISKPAST